jgi:hypothetical protein
MAVKSTLRDGRSIIFHVRKIMVYALALFLIAGIAVLIK